MGRTVPPQVGSELPGFDGLSGGDNSFFESVLVSRGASQEQPGEKLVVDSLWSQVT